MYTKAQMLTQVRALLNETTALFWTDTELANYLDMGARTMSGITLCTPVSEFVDADNTSWATSTLSAPLTAKFIKIVSVEIYSSGATTHNGTSPVQLQRSDIRTWGHGAPGLSTGTNISPQWYYIWGGGGLGTANANQQRIFVWPCPKGTYVVATGSNGGYMKVHGFRSAWNYDHYALYDDTPSSGVYDIPDRLQARLIDFVLACAYIKAGKYSLTSFHMRNFMQNAMFDRKDVFESNGIVDSLDRMMIPDRTQVAGQAG
jgi:hypothetical protein